jgi:predicted metal-dependent phosphoesterase TrpH
MLRGDLHHHIDTDPVDGRFVRHSAGELIDRAAAVGLNVLAITCHEAVPYDGDATRYAADRGVLLLRGMEATVDGNHVLLLNFREFPPGICTMTEVEERKTPDALVIAPHPFYPVGSSVGSLLTTHRSVFDAVEFSGMYTALTPWFNRRAVERAGTLGLPVVGDTDTHFLWQLGRTFTLIDAPPEPVAVLDAIRHGRVQLVTQPLSWTRIVRFFAEQHATVSTLKDSLRYMTRILRRTRVSEPASERNRFTNPMRRSRNDELG